MRSAAARTSSAVIASAMVTSVQDAGKSTCSGPLKRPICTTLRTPGADDDASGVAGLLEAARVLSSHRFAYTILFIAFDSEEIRCSGAGSYVMRHANEGIVGMVELDMIAYNHMGGRKGEIWTGVPGENATSKALAAALKKYVPELTVTYRGSDPASDHGPFEAAGFASALLTEAEPYSPYYHKAADAATDNTGAVDMLMADGSPYIDYAYATTMTRGAAGWLADAAVPTGEVASVRPKAPGRGVDPGVRLRPLAR